MRQDTLDRLHAEPLEPDTRPYCCRTFATGRCPTCVEEMALEAENRWQNGRPDPERYPGAYGDDWRERGQEADEPGPGTYEDHLRYSGLDRCERCGEKAGVEMAEVYRPADPGRDSEYVHVACMQEGDAIA